MTRALERGMRLLEALAAIPGTASVQDLAAHSRLPPATCTRLLHQLVLREPARKLRQAGIPEALLRPEAPRGERRRPGERCSA